ncbi:MAG: hypothetical protein MJZ40_00685 [Bacteroidaceae bacterium]|nr:hypothetical protein [Bacteroidaceae bacterium]
MIDYPNKWDYIYRGFTWQWAYILFYFIGRTSGLNIKEALSRMKWPVLIACVCGLYFFFTEPSWYMDMKYSQITSEYATEHYIQEIFRLSSFWGHPYQLSYATFLYSLLLINSLYDGKKHRTNSTTDIDSNEHIEYLDDNEEDDKSETEYLYQEPKKTRKLFIVIQLILVGVVLLLAQIRVALFMFVISLVYFFLKKNQASVAKKVIITAVTTLMISLGIYYGQRYLPDSNVEYITEHISDIFDREKTEERFDHTSGDVEIIDPLFGNGFARYNFVARNYHKFAMIDNEYQKQYYETGIVGITLLVWIFLCFAIQLKRKNNRHIERCIFMFIVVGCACAGLLSNPSQYGYLLWFAMGTLYYPQYDDKWVEEYED